MSLRGLLLILGGVLLSPVFGGEGAHAQERPDARPDTSASPTPPDSLNRSAPRRARQTSRPPGTTGPGGGPGGAPEAVTFSAQDSMVIRTAPEGRDQGMLYGNASMSYQGASLQAQTIEMNFQTGTLRATGAPSDTAQGSRPRFQMGSGGSASGGPGSSGPRPPGSGGTGGGQSFTGKVLSYNLNTKRGRVVAARTQQRDGYVQGEAVKVFEDSTLFVNEGTYTTCKVPTGVSPSYSLRSNRMKLSDRWVYTGPIQLYLFNVPTPLWLPFGLLPNIQGRRSGPLAPEYGEDRRGFYLRDWGWYFALNQYTDLTIRAGIWSQGSFEIRPRFRYEKRYNYSGDLQVTYRRERRGEEIDPDFVNRHEGQIQWNHSQDLSPTASINGDVNLVTSSNFARRNSRSYNDAVSQEARSSISYRKRWPNGGRSLNISANQSQQFQSGAVSMTLPNLGFSQNSFKPFQQGQRVGQERWYEKITTSYDLDVRNSYTFRPRDPQELRRNGTPADSALADSIQQADISWYEALFDRQKYQLATGEDELYDFQASHRIPLNVSFRVDRYNLSLSPNARYTSDWYLSTVRRTAQRDSTGRVGDIMERTVPGFYARHDFSTSFSASSEIYGTFPVGVGPFQGLRHRLSPSLSMNYQPNFNAPLWGRTRVLRFPNGTPVVRDSTGTLVPQDSATGEPVRYDILEGQSVRRSTQQWSLNFSLRNVFETKRVTTDSTGRQNSQRVQLLNLDVSGLSYNFAADSFRVGSNIGINARTRIDPFNISLRSSFSPYALRRTTFGGETRFRREDRLMVAESPLTPVRLTQFRFSLGADFSSEGGGRGGPVGRNRRRGREAQRRGPSDAGRQGGRRPSRRGSTERGSSSRLSDIQIPWSLNFNFNYGLRKPRKDVTNRNATLSVNFNLNVTQMWRVQGNTGYDFVEGELSTTRISINRSLGCWDMSFSWVPFGRFKSYSFNLQVSSGQLSQLLQLQVPRQGGRGRLGGFGDQLRGTVRGAAGGGLGGAGGTGSYRRRSGGGRCTAGPVRR
ncbi:MAG: putative LPS assembly protein LptD [Salinibacter sp.]